MDGKLMSWNPDKVLLQERNNKLVWASSITTGLKLDLTIVLPMPRAHFLSPLLLGLLCSKYKKLNLQVK